MPFHSTALVALLQAVLPSSPGDYVERRTDHLILTIEETKADRLDDLAPLAEAIWERLVVATGYRPDRRIQLAFHDEDDYSNGWAIPHVAWVNVWLTPTLFPFRGGEHWERDVISHEMAHVFTLQALGETSSFEGVGLGGDVLDGSRRLSGSTFVPGTAVETWLAEGLAQVGAEFCRADSWDAHRDLLEGGAWRSGAILPDGLLRDHWGDMRHGEQIYGQGYSFVRYVLGNGSMAFPVLLREGRTSGFRQACEKSMGGTFSTILSRWSASLAMRHGKPEWPAEPGRDVLPAVPAASWVAQSGGVSGDGRSWVVSSHDNDYGDGSLYEVGPRGARRIAVDVVGRPRRTSDGRILFVREDQGISRNIIRDAWILDPRSGRTSRLTRDLRIQEIDATRDGYVAIDREGGRSRVVSLGLQGEVRFRFPRGSGLPIQIAADAGSDRVWATMETLRGFGLFQMLPDSQWHPLFGDTLERRDPTWAQGRLWYSRLSGGRWGIASLDSTGIERVEATAVGGLFFPVPVGDSLLAIRYQRQGYFAVVLPRGGASSGLEPIPPAKPLTDTGIASVVPAEQGRNRAGSLWDPDLVSQNLGFGLIDQRLSGGEFQPGTKIYGSWSGFISDPRMEATLELWAEMLHGAPWLKAGWDPAAGARVSNTRYGPQFEIHGSIDQLTFEEGIYQWDTLLQRDQTDIGASVTLQPLSRLAISGGIDLIDATVAFQGVPSGSYVIAEETDIGLGFRWNDFAAGRFGPWSGWGIGVGGTYIDSRSDFDTVGKPAFYAFDMGLDLVGNIRRRVVLDLSASGHLEASSTNSDRVLQGAVGAGLGVPLPFHWSLPLGGQRRMTWVDGFLQIGQSLALGGADTTMGSPLVARDGHFMSSSAWNPTNPYKVLQLDGVRSVPMTGVSLSWKFLSWANRRSDWSFGASVPWEGDWRDVRYRAMISL